MADDEATQIAVLRSRVEQQAELIMLLKQGSDDMRGQHKDLQDTITKLNFALAQKEKDALDRKEAHDKLQGNFATLVANHESMIELKDQYKIDAQKLRKENGEINAKLANFNETLSKEISKVNTEWESKVNAEKNEHQKNETSLKKQLEDLLRNNESLRKELQDVKNDFQKQKTSSETQNKDLKAVQSEISELKTTLTSVQTKHELVLNEFEQYKNQAMADNLKLENENEAFKQDQVVLKNEISGLQRALADAQADKKLGEARFEIDELNHRIASLTQEYSAFKKYSNELLAKEKEINARLRHLSH